MYSTSTTTALPPTHAECSTLSPTYSPSSSAGFSPPGCSTWPQTVSPSSSSAGFSQPGCSTWPQTVSPWATTFSPSSALPQTHAVSPQTGCSNSHPSTVEFSISTIAPPSDLSSPLLPLENGEPPAKKIKTEDYKPYGKCSNQKYSELSEQELSERIKNSANNYANNPQYIPGEFDCEFPEVDYRKKLQGHWPTILKKHKVREQDSVVPSAQVSEETLEIFTKQQSVFMNKSMQSISQR